MSQLKPGDFALTLVEVADVPLMACVEVVDIHHAGKPVLIKGVMRVFKQDFYVADYQGGLYGYSIKSLMPLRGDFQTDQQKSREVVN